MLIRKIYCSRSFVLESAHVKRIFRLSRAYKTALLIVWFWFCFSFQAFDLMTWLSCSLTGFYGRWKTDQRISPEEGQFSIKLIQSQTKTDSGYIDLPRRFLPFWDLRKNFYGGQVNQPAF